MCNMMVSGALRERYDDGEQDDLSSDDKCKSKGDENLEHLIKM